LGLLHRFRRLIRSDRGFLLRLLSLLFPSDLLNRLRRSCRSDLLFLSHLLSR
jgi:hypothetical protein